MKNLILVAITAFSSLTAFASSQVCSGERLYASNVHVDSGIPPLEGMVTASHVIVFDRNVLLSYDDIQGLFVQGVAPYQVSHESDETVLAEISTPSYTEKTYTVTAVLNRVDSMTHEVLEEMGRELVVCRNIQKFVP